MAFQINITEPALADAEDYVRFIREVGKQPEAAERWFRRLVRAIYSLEDSCLATLRFRLPSLGCKQELRHALNDNLGLDDA